MQYFFFMIYHVNISPFSLLKKKSAYFKLIAQALVRCEEA